MRKNILFCIESTSEDCRQFNIGVTSSDSSVKCWNFENLEIRKSKIFK